MSPVQTFSPGFPEGGSVASSVARSCIRMRKTLQLHVQEMVCAGL